MNFATCLLRLHAYHTIVLETGGRDEVALDFAVTTAAKALELAPPTRLAVLDEDQQGEVLNLRQLHAQGAASGADWDQPSRRAWLEEALKLLRLLRG